MKRTIQQFHPCNPLRYPRVSRALYKIPPSLLPISSPLCFLRFLLFILSPREAHFPFLFIRVHARFSSSAAAVPCFILALAALCLITSPAHAKSATNAPPVVERRKLPPTPDGLIAEKQKLAEGYERSGQTLKAAEVYEALLREDPARNKAVVHRLVKIYAEAGKTAEALRWAEVAAKSHPDPKAMMAGVHDMLGDRATAVRLLQLELKGENPSRRQLTLHWQLAGIYEKMGVPDMAEKHLRLAVDAAQSPPFKAAAERRLKEFQQARQ